MNERYSKRFVSHLFTLVICLVALGYQKSYSADVKVVTINKGQSITLRVNTFNAAAYQWYKDGVMVQDSVKSTFTTRVAGTYTVMSFNKEGCPSLMSDVIAVKVIDNLVDLTLTKKSEIRQVHIGESFTYTLTVKNIGKITATKVIVNDALPSKLEFQSLNNPTLGSAYYNQSTHAIVWMIDSLQVNQSAELSLLTKANTYGNVTNTASTFSAQQDADSTNNFSSDTKDILGLKIPNVFTPNGDGRNDTFIIPDLENYTANELIIFNRWGNTVFQTKNYHNDWNGSRLNEGTYFYILKVMTADGTWQTYHGYLTLLRTAVK